MKGERVGMRVGKSEKEGGIGFEFFRHNIKLLITGLEHWQGNPRPADCDLGSATV